MSAEVTRALDWSEGAERTMVITPPPCIMCGKQDAIKVDMERLHKWRNGQHIQVAFDNFDANKREQLMSGIHGECYDKMFGDE